MVCRAVLLFFFLLVGGCFGFVVCCFVVVGGSLFVSGCVLGLLCGVFWWGFCLVDVVLVVCWFGCCEVGVVVWDGFFFVFGVGAECCVSWLDSVCVFLVVLGCLFCVCVCL